MRNLLAYSTEVPEGVSGALMYGLEVTIIGVLIVFAVLALIMCVIYLFQLIFSTKKEKTGKAPAKEISKTPVKSAPVPSAPVPAPAAGNPEELVAVIAAATAMAQEELIVVLAAAVAAHEGCDPASSRYRIRSFRRIL